MKLNLNVGFAVFLGLLSAGYIFHLAHWSYHPFDDPFIFWKAAVDYGVPILTTLVWMWIIEMAFHSRGK